MTVSVGNVETKNTCGEVDAVGNFSGGDLGLNDPNSNFNGGDLADKVTDNSPNDNGTQNGSELADKDDRVKGVTEEVHTDKGLLVDFLVNLIFDVVHKEIVNIDVGVNDGEIGQDSEVEKEDMVTERIDLDCEIIKKVEEIVINKLEYGDSSCEIDGESVEVISEEPGEFDQVSKAEKPLGIIDDNKESQIVVMTNVCDSSSPDDDVEQSVNGVESTISELIEVPVFLDDNQTEVKVKEASIVPKLIFPNTFVNPGIQIQFGSFGLEDSNLDKFHGDLDLELQVSNEETGPTCDTNSSIPELIYNDLQESESVETDVHEEDTDKRINEFKDVIDYETLDSLVGSEDEVQQAVPVENLRMELNDASENEVATLAIRKTYEEENENREEQQAPFQAIVVSSSEKTASSNDKKQSGDKTTKKVVGKMKTKEPVRFLIEESVFTCLNDIMEDEENVVEFEKKADELREKKQLWSEEKKEKARKKRLRQKERRTGGDSSNMNNENTAKLNTENETEKADNVSKQLNPKIINAARVVVLLCLILVSFIFL